MLRGPLIHPEILRVLGESGHGSRVLIADGNYPFKTKRGAFSEVTYLNLAPGRLTVTEVLDALVATIPIEAACVMVPDDGSEPEIFPEFRKRLPGLDLMPFDRFAFYEQAMDPHVSLVVATGDQRLFANLLLTIGVEA